MKTLRWYALPSLFTATWFALAVGTLIQFAALGGALTQLDGRPRHAPAQNDDVAAESIVEVQ
ncbi:MAG TPA: hypothetical protein VK540_02005 [Polyangiaceae bacterium]|jgi:hypothetical protein|nr:hypothetical protein [Polyangiaceae bacterium]